MKIIKDGEKEISVVSLDEASQAQFSGKEVQSEVIVIGKNMTPYLIPKEVKLSCYCIHKKEKCELCPLKETEVAVFSLLQENQLLLLLIDCTTLQQLIAIRMKYGHNNCSNMHVEMKHKQNLEYIIGIPQVRTDSKYVTLGMYYQGHGITTNKSYNIKGTIVPHPLTQAVTCVISQVEETQGSLDKFVITDEIVNLLKIFKGEE